MAEQQELGRLNLSKTEQSKTTEVLFEKLDSYCKEPNFLNLESSTLKKYKDQLDKSQIKKFLMPDDHPIKSQLDAIFSASRVFYDFESMVLAGFDPALPQHHTHIIVTRHLKLKGYVIKAYLDIQEYHSGKPEHYFWIKRCIGASLIRKCIEDENYSNLLKVPKKWIYALPANPPPPLQNCIRKMFILVEEDMNIYDEKTNLAWWGSQLATKEHLKALYTVITKLSLHDCAKPANCPVSKDGRIAFVDTQSYHKKRVSYHKLTYHLDPCNREYWLQLIEEGNK